MSEKTNNTFKECCDLYMKERITNSFAETIKHTWDYRQKEIDQLKEQIEELRKVIIEYEREAARERIRKRRGYAPMVRRN